LANNFPEGFVMTHIMDEEVVKKIQDSGVIAVLIIDDAENAVPLAKALLRGGITSIELTLRTPAAFDALARIKAGVPEINAGLGTIITREQVRLAHDAGAAFGVSPGYNTKTGETATLWRFPFIPGVSTASEIESAYSDGFKTLKFFPAESLGGLAYLKNVNAPYVHLGIRYIPLGGISVGNLKAYLENEAVLAVGGSWLAPRDMVNAKNWDQISRNCEEAMDIVHEVRGK
jgi:2-dehydro-3-deoxyphosphogluconate aldolase/(4S)-4-hydroxy-2-oxoglutarate aldolase